ncbi:hypothetical protein A0H81_13444 [Grifola frondosa]|uniref:Uncharacterized protein n=1 Tax=Grifola frondosa TaxID=5627 RepID=A0A1C7LPH8_GRIFR|nr:hypothetical protein A0H81_13444 [Grifola frondosa]
MLYCSKGVLNVAHSLVLPSFPTVSPSLPSPSLPASRVFFNAAYTRHSSLASRLTRSACSGFQLGLATLAHQLRGRHGANELLQERERVLSRSTVRPLAGSSAASTSTDSSSDNAAKRRASSSMAGFGDGRIDPLGASIRDASARSRRSISFSIGIGCFSTARS